MNKLFEHIKASFENQALPEKPDNAWENFLKYKEKRDNKTIFPWTKIFLLTLLALLIGSNLFWALHTTNRMALDRKTIMVRDTLYLKNQTSIAGREQNQNPQNAEILVKLDKLQDKLEEFKQKYLNLQSFISSHINDNTRSFTSRHIALEHAKDRLQKIQQSFNSTPLSGFVYPAESSSTLAPSTVKQEQLDIPGTITSYLRSPAYTRGYSIGRPYYYILQNRYHKAESMGWMARLRQQPVYLAAHSGVYGIYDPRLSVSSGVGVGLAIHSVFAKQIRASLGVDFMITKGHVEDHEKFAQLPPIFIPDGGVIKEVYYDANMSSFNLSLDYLFPVYWKLRPYAGLSYYYNAFRNNELRYECINRSQEFYQLVDSPNLDYLHQALGIRLGTDINISDAIDAYLHTSFQLNKAQKWGFAFQINPGLYYYLY